MLGASIVAAAFASSALAAPAKVQKEVGLSVPYSDLTVPIVGAVPRSQRKVEQLQRHIQLLKGEAETGFHQLWEGDGATYEFFAPGSGSEYAVNVTVAGQNVSVIFDTGSSDLWFPATNFTCLFVNGTETDQSECNFGPTYFDIGAASAAGDIVPVNFTNNFNISYGDGEYATGSAYIGSVSFAGIDVKNTEFSVVEESYWAGDGVTNGLIGFANPLLTSVFRGSDPTADNNTLAAEYLPWFYQANADGLVSPSFAIALNRPTLAQEISDDGYAILSDLGSVTLGGIPSNESVPLTGKSVTVDNVFFNATRNGQNISVPAYYTVPVDSWNYKGSKHHDTSSPLTILDSGTTLIYAPNHVADKFAKQFVPPAGPYNETLGAYEVLCDAQIPDLSVTIGGVEFPFTKEDLIFGLDPNGTICMSSIVRGGNTTDDVYILGDRFLVNVVASFNIEKNDISIFERTAY